MTVVITKSVVARKSDPVGHARQGRRDEKMTRRMRLPIIPFPGESLPGVLSRSTRLNVLEHNKHLLGMAGLEFLNPALATMLPDPDIARIADVIGCDAELLRTCANPYITPAKRFDGLKVGDGVIRRTDLELANRRIAPRILLRSGHHRSSWLVKLLPFCPESLEQLRGDCPECGGRLGWRNAYDMDACDACRATISPSLLPDLSPDLVDDYRLFAALVSSIPAERQAALDQLPPDVHALDPLAMVDLCLQLGSLCRKPPMFVPRLAFADLEPPVLASIVAGGAALLRNWPDGAIERCRAEADSIRDQPSAFDRYRDAIRKLGTGPHSRPSQIELVRAAFPDMFGSYSRSFAEQGAIVVGKEACAATSLAPRELRLLRESGIVRARELPSGSGSRRRFQLDRTDVLEVASALDDIVEAASLGWKLGIPLNAVEQLCCLGLLHTADHPAVTKLRKLWHVTKVSALALQTALAEAAAVGTPPPDAVPLHAAAQRIGGGMKPWGPILSAMIDGTLPFWKTGEGSLTHATMVVPGTLRCFSVADFDETYFPDFSYSPCITAYDAGSVLNVGERELNKVRQILQGMLSLDGSRNWSRAKVIALAAEVVSSSETARRAGRSVPWIRSRLDRAGIRPGILGWPRAAVESLDWMQA